MKPYIDVSLEDRQDMIDVVDKPNASSRLWRFVLSAVVIAAAMVAVWLVVTDNAKRKLVAELANATERGELYTLIHTADWDVLRDDMKRDLLERAQRSAALPEEPRVVEELVDYYVRPEYAPELMRHYQQKAAHIPPHAFVRQVRFSGLTEVTVELASPPQFDKPWLNQLEPVLAVFRFNAPELSWKLQKLRAPDYLIPASVPAIAFKKGVL